MQVGRAVFAARRIAKDEKMTYFPGVVLKIRSIQHLHRFLVFFLRFQHSLHVSLGLEVDGFQCHHLVLMGFLHPLLTDPGSLPHPCCRHHHHCAHEFDCRHYLPPNNGEKHLQHRLVADDQTRPEMHGSCVHVFIA